jgi:hypothetical protein
MQVKILSIKQPFAWLIVNGYKDIENRTWYSSYRGTLYIHAGKSFDSDGYDWVRSNFPNIIMPLKSDFELGGVVGFVDMTGCTKFSKSKWFVGDYGFIMSDPKVIPFIPLKGQLGIFNGEI